MSRKLDGPVLRRHVQIYEEDWEYLMRAYGPGSPTRFGVGPAIRQIVHAKVAALKAKYQELVDSRKQPTAEEEELEEAAEGRVEE